MQAFKRVEKSALYKVKKRLEDREYRTSFTYPVQT